MSGLAQLMHHDGAHVHGSDISPNAITKKLQDIGIQLNFAQDGSGVTDDIDLVVYSSAVPVDNPERAKAAQLSIPQQSYFEAVGEYAKQFTHVIAVSGTHGKSTTTAMLGTIFAEAGFDPTVLVGSIVGKFENNVLHGSKNFFIVEACEYREHMKKIPATTIVLTNIEADHLDYYTDQAHIERAFQEYVNALPSHGHLVKNSDDSATQNIRTTVESMTYGIHTQAQQQAKNILTDNGRQFFSIGDAQYTLKIPGKFNVANALAASTAAKMYGVPEDTIIQALSDYEGIWRRFQQLGEYKEATVISDYAHHPTAVAATITAAKEFFPGRRVIAIFQPHQRSRTEKLFDQFTQAFDEADSIIIQEIYDVAGREEAGSEISSKDIVEVLQGRDLTAVYTKDAEETQHEIDHLMTPGDVLLIMGAGDVYQLAEDIAK